MKSEKNKNKAKNNAKNIIIAVLVCAIIAGGGVLGYVLYSDRAEKDAANEVSTAAEDNSVSPEALEEILKQQMMAVNGIHYYYKTSSEQLKYDAMGASVINNSDVEITDFVVAFCAFDSEGKPIKILQPEEEGEGGYIRTINYDFTKAQGEKAALEPGETCKDILMYVKSEPQIVTVKACVKSYVSVDSVEWNNPYYSAFLEMYSGKVLN